MKRGFYATERDYTMAKNSAYRKTLAKKPTEAELVFKAYLEECEIKFIFQKGFITPFHRIADFYLKKHSLIIEIDGGYHYTEETKRKDEYKDKMWKEKRGMKTLRITNEEVFNEKFKEILLLNGIC